MNKLKQAARQIIVDWDSGIHLYEAITALREALAEQAEQEPLLWGDDKFAPHERPQNHEPVAWALSHSMGLEFGSKYPIQETKEAAEQMARQHMGAVVVTPLYAAPVRTKDLTDDEIWEVHFNPEGYQDFTAIARAVIAADREKNK